MLLGCGSSAKPLARISLAVSVPADGATVAVPQIEIEGTVTPAVAFVQVAGHPVGVRGGEFSRAMLLHLGTNRIQIVAAASGYPSTGSDLTVSYHPSPSESAAALRRSYLIGQVNSVCATVDGLLGLPSRRRLASADGLQNLLDSDAQLVNQLQGIRAPLILRSTYRAFLGSLRQMGNLGSDLFGPPPDTIRRIRAEAGSIGARGAGLARQLGFTQCVPNMSPGVLPLG
jgi:Glucodextranase, domain B